MLLELTHVHLAKAVTLVLTVAPIYRTHPLCSNGPRLENHKGIAILAKSAVVRTTEALGLLSFSAPLYGAEHPWTVLPRLLNCRPMAVAHRAEMPHLMKTVVFRWSQHFQIFQAVIRLHLVFVVNVAMGWDRTVSLFPNNPMLQSVSSFLRYPDVNVAVHPYPSPSIPIRILLSTKWAGLTSVTFLWVMKRLAIRSSYPRYRFAANSAWFRPQFPRHDVFYHAGVGIGY